MASYGRHFPAAAATPPQSSSTSFVRPPQQQQQHQGGGSGGGGGVGGYVVQNYHRPLPPPHSNNNNYGIIQPQQQHLNNYAYQQPPPPPPPSDSSYPQQPPPPPPSMMYYNQPPPPPPDSSSIVPPPPPPPPSSPPPPPPPSQHQHLHLHKPPPPPPPPPLKSISKSKPPPASSETEEARRLRKKRELDKHHHLSQHNNNTNKLSSKTSSKLPPPHHHFGSRSILNVAAERSSSTPLITPAPGPNDTTTSSSSRTTENRFKKPTTFLCRMKFRNEVPDPTSLPKLMSLPKDNHRNTKYSVTSLEKMYKPELYVDPDLGIPLDLLDLTVYNPPKGRQLSLAPDDKELVRDDEAATPVKNDGIKRKERPTDKGVSWLVKTQYISPLNNDAAKQSLTEKQAKELRDKKGGAGNILDNNNKDRKFQHIVASFEASKSRPVHATNKKLVPKEIIPLFPDFDRYKDQFVIATFDGAPTVDSELYRKLESSVRDEHESRAVMKSFVARGSDQGVPDKFLAYMVPALDELPKDMHDENEDIMYSWVREYQWDVRGEDLDDPTTYVVSFNDGEARYAPLPTKLILRKKRAKEGRSGEEAEHFPVPASVTVRKRSSVAAIELNDVSHNNAKGNMSNLKREGMDIEDGLRRANKIGRHSDMDQSSGAEDEDDDMSE